MKVYQIHEYGGEWEGSYDYIRFTYLSEDKAKLKLKKLEDQELLARMCKNCPLDYCSSYCEGEHACETCNEKERIKEAKNYCKRCDIEKIKDDCSKYAYIQCTNNSWHHEDSYFRIEEIDVIE